MIALSLPLTLLPLFVIIVWAIFATLQWLGERREACYWRQEAREVHEEFLELAREAPFYSEPIRRKILANSQREC